MTHLWNKIFFSNGHFLLGNIARDVDVLHSIQKWTGNGIECVGSAEEENMREVDRDVEIVVEEC